MSTSKVSGRSRKVASQRNINQPAPLQGVKCSVKLRGWFFFLETFFQTVWSGCWLRGFLTPTGGGCFGNEAVVRTAGIREDTCALLFS